MTATLRPNNDTQDPAPSQVGRVADALRLWITEGSLPSGTQMSEEALVKQLGVSRNTLREAFRLLAHDGLLVHRFNRGVFVPELGVVDLADVYRLRMIVEPHVVRSLVSEDALRLDLLRDAVLNAEEAAKGGRWAEVGTANIHFHRSLVHLARSPRLDALAERLLAELRLLFAVIDKPQHLYEPYVARNRYLYEGLLLARFEEMAEYLHCYLQDSAAALRSAFEEKLV
jgi:DNA-binding GntR family transcriptional regulator